MVRQIAQLQQMNSPVAMSHVDVQTAVGGRHVMSHLYAV